MQLATSSNQPSLRAVIIRADGTREDLGELHATFHTVPPAEQPASTGSGRDREE